MFRSNSKFVIINKTYRPREWSILHWLYVDAVKAEFVNILKKLDTYSISTISRDETLISRLTRLFPPKTGLQWWSNGGSRGGSRGAGPPHPAPIRQDPCLRQPCSQGSLLPTGRVRENPGNEVLFETEIRTLTGLYNTLTGRFFNEMRVTFCH